MKLTKPPDASLCELIQALDRSAKALGVAYFLIGATARDILLEHVHGIDATRATRDVDFAVAVASWEEFDRLKQHLLLEGRFTAGSTAQHLVFGTDTLPYPLDLVPFAGVAEHNQVAWPPGGEFVMNVAGYDDACDSAIEVEIAPGFQIKVVSMPALVVLKILAWNDRPESDKHASDVLLVLQNYHRAGQFDRLYEQIELLEAYDYDLELAGAALLAKDARRDVAHDVRVQVTEVFANERSANRFVAQMRRSGRGDPERAMLSLQVFLKEISN